MESQVDKIKREVDTKNYFNDGLNMIINIDNFLVSLKSSWIQKFLRGEQSWINIFYTIHGNTTVSKVLDIDDDFIMKLLEKTTNNFWVDVLKSC